MHSATSNTFIFRALLSSPLKRIHQLLASSASLDKGVHRCCGRSEGTSPEHHQLLPTLVLEEVVEGQSFLLLLLTCPLGNLWQSHLQAEVSKPECNTSRGKTSPAFLPQQNPPFRSEGVFPQLPGGAAVAAGPVCALHSPGGCSLWCHPPCDLRFGGDTGWLSQGFLCGTDPVWAMTTGVRVTTTL